MKSTLPEKTIKGLKSVYILAGCIFLANAAYVQATLTWCLLTPFLYKVRRSACLCSAITLCYHLRSAAARMLLSVQNQLFNAACVPARSSTGTARSALAWR